MSNKKFIPVANPFLDQKKEVQLILLLKKMDNNGEKVKEFEKIYLNF